VATLMKMPQLGQTMEEGTIITWLKREGDGVRQGEPLVQIETDKVVCDLEASQSGLLHTILAREGEKVPVGNAVAVIAAAGETVNLTALLGAVPAANVSSTAPAQQGRAVPQSDTPPPRMGGEAPPTPRDIRISPAARKLAREHGLALEHLQGTGPAGRIVVEDVERALATPPAAAAPERVLRTIPLTGVRGTIASRMAQSWAQVAHVTEVIEVDMSAAMALRRQRVATWEREHGVRVSVADFVTFAVARTLRDLPDLNARLEGQEIHVLDDIHVGIAVATPAGLIVPVIRHADRLSLWQIALHGANLADKTRERRLALDEVLGGTFTITNLGTYGIEIFTPIVNYPQCAILGVGRVAERPVVVPGRIEARPMMYLSLSFDHRLVDGAPAAMFLQRLKERLETLSDFPV
jgi:pyruvate dehydrogenase E2 component (dihydrolipoamide acetyltransferase)